MNDAIITSNIRKRFISNERTGFLRRRKIVVEALRGVSFRVRWGEVYGLLGLMVPVKRLPSRYCLPC